MTDTTTASSSTHPTPCPRAPPCPSASSLCPHLPSPEQLRLFDNSSLLSAFHSSSQELEQGFRAFADQIVAFHQRLSWSELDSTALAAALSTLHLHFIAAYTTVVDLFTARAHSLLTPPRVRSVRALKPSQPSPTPPSSTSPPPRRSYPRSATAPLRRWFLRHLDAPYPRERQKAKLVAASGLTAAQVSNFFVNARGRLWKKWIVQQKAETKVHEPTPPAPHSTATGEQRARKRQRTNSPQRPSMPRRKRAPLPAPPLSPALSPPVGSAAAPPSPLLPSAPPLSLAASDGVPGLSSPCGTWTPAAAAGGPSAFSFTSAAIPAMPTSSFNSPTLFSRSLSRVLTAFSSPTQPHRTFASSQHFRMSLTLSAFQPLPLSLLTMEGMGGWEGGPVGESGEGGEGGDRWRLTRTQTQWEQLARQRPLSTTTLVELSAEDEDQLGSSPALQCTERLQ